MKRNLILTLILFILTIQALNFVADKANPLDLVTQNPNAVGNNSTKIIQEPKPLRSICYVCCFNDGPCNRVITYESKDCCNANCNRDCSEVEQVEGACLVRGVDCKMVRPQTGVFASVTPTLLRQVSQVQSRQLEPVTAKVNVLETEPDLTNLTMDRLRLSESSETVTQ